MNPLEIELHGKRVKLGFLGKGKLFDTDVTGEEVVAEANNELRELTPLGHGDDRISWAIGDDRIDSQTGEYLIGSNIVAERIYEVLPERIRRPTLDEVVNLINTSFKSDSPLSIPLGLVCYASPHEFFHYNTQKLYTELERREKSGESFSYPLLLRNVAVRKEDQTAEVLYLKDDTCVLEVPALMMTADEFKRGNEEYLKRIESLRQQLRQQLREQLVDLTEEDLMDRVIQQSIEDGIYGQGEFGIELKDDFQATFERRTSLFGKEKSDVSVTLVGNKERGMEGVCGLFYHCYKIASRKTHYFEVEQDHGIDAYPGKILLIKDL